MDIVEDSRKKLEVIEKNIEERQEVLSNKKSEKSQCESSLRILDSKEYDKNYTIPNIISSELKKITLYTGSILIALTLFFSAFVDYWLITTFKYFIPILLAGTIPATLVGTYYFFKNTARDRRELKRLNNIDYNAERSKLNSNINNLKKEIIYIESQIITLNNQKNSILRQLKNGINIATQVIETNYENNNYESTTYENDRNIHRRR